MNEVPLTHLSSSGDPLASNAACDFQPSDGEGFGMTSEAEYVTCPDCLIRVLS